MFGVFQRTGLNENVSYDKQKSIFYISKSYENQAGICIPVAARKVSHGALSKTSTKQGVFDSSPGHSVLSKYNFRTHYSNDNLAGYIFSLIVINQNLFPTLLKLLV